MVSNSTRTEKSVNETSIPANTFRHRLRVKILNPMVCTLLASTGIFGGIAALFIGLVCVVVHAIIAGDHTFDRVGTVLLIAAIPSILIGSIFLDEITVNK